MYHSIREFEENYKYESGGTLKILKCLTDESLKQAVTDGHRNLGRIAWHITTTIPEMMNRTGLGVSAVKAEDPVPATAREIADAYEKASTELLEKIKANWNDESLQVEDEMYGMKWKKGATLSILIGHESHHRGQMTVLMRQAGLKVIGIYGPSYDEWDQFDQKPPEV